MEDENEESIRDSINNAGEFEPTQLDKLRAQIERLAGLDDLAYALERREVAKDLKILVGSLDKQVDKARRRNNRDSSAEESRRPAAADGARVRRYFAPLGTQGKTFYYLTNTGGNVDLTSHGKLQLLKLCPHVDDWKGDFPGDKGEPDWDRAAAFTIRICRDLDFNPSQLRGRGIWFDDGRMVFNLGTQLIVDQGEPTLLRKLENSDFIYQRGAPWRLNLIKVLGDADAQKLIALLEGFNWRNPKVAARLAAGWIVCALVCGALRWRPHFLISAENEAGKSWIIENIIQPLLAEFALFSSGTSTEAGLRRDLNLDSRSVVLDEFGNPDDRETFDHLKAIYALALLASDDSTSEVKKASGEGTKLYRVRGCWLLSVVNPSFRSYAQASRMTAVELLLDDKPEHANRFKARKAAVKELLTREWCANLRARAFKLAAIIRHNAETLSGALATDGGQRVGDQLGAIYAGVCALESSELLTPEAARKWIAKLPQPDAGDEPDKGPPRDKRRLWARIVQIMIKVQLIQHDDPRSTDRSFGEIFEAVHSGQGDRTAYVEELAAAAKRNGILVERDDKEGKTWVYVPNQHEQLKRLLGGIEGWNDVLALRPECVERGVLKRFFGEQHRCVKLDYNALRLEEETPF